MIIIINKHDMTMTVYTTHVSVHNIAHDLDARSKTLDAIGFRIRENDTIIVWKIDPIAFAVVCMYVEELKNAKNYAKN